MKRIVGDVSEFEIVRLSLKLLDGKHLIHQLLQSIIVDLIVQADALSKRLSYSDYVHLCLSTVYLPWNQCFRFFSIVTAQVGELCQFKLRQIAIFSQQTTYMLEEC